MLNNEIPEISIDDGAIANHNENGNNTYVYIGVHICLSKYMLMQVYVYKYILFVYKTYALKLGIRNSIHCPQTQIKLYYRQFINYTIDNLSFLSGKTL